MRKICIDSVCVPVSESRLPAISQQYYVLKNLLGRQERKKVGVKAKKKKYKKPQPSSGDIQLADCMFSWLVLSLVKGCEGGCNV